MTENTTAHSQKLPADTSVAVSAETIPPHVFDVEEAMKFLRIRRVKLFDLLRSGKIDSCRVGNKRLIFVQSLIAFLDNAPKDQVETNIAKARKARVAHLEVN